MIRAFLKRLIPFNFVLLLKEWREKENRKRIQREINNLTKNKIIVNLEIGFGPKKGTGDWITLDLCNECDIKYDVRNGIPFADSSINMLYSSHLLEHFAFKDLLTLLHECHRVLRINGRFSACVPDASIYIKEYLKPNITQFEHIYNSIYPFNTSIDLINYIAYMNGNHKYMFDRNNIVNILELIGFKNIKIREFDPSIDNIDRKWESLYVDAIK